jgi:uncharacterized protein with FMN-binding domain
METFNPGRAIRKFFLSAFVIIAFAAYVLQQQLANQGQNMAAAALANGSSNGQQVGDALPSTPSPTPNDLATLPGTSTPFAPALTDTPELATATPTGVAPVTDTPAPAATDTPAPLPSPTATSRGAYKNGTYTGPLVDAYYGLVQVQAIVKNGQIFSIQFLNYPHDRRTSQEINSQAMPWLEQEAVQAQSANVDIISGATLTSEAFIQSLRTALLAARG